VVEGSAGLYIEGYRRGLSHDVLIFFKE